MGGRQCASAHLKSIQGKAKGGLMTENLIGWQQIAAHLRVSTKTALRYLKIKGLPVTYDENGHATTSKKELDRWRFGDMAEHCPDDDR
jgi:hypothetical protein